MSRTRIAGRPLHRRFQRFRSQRGGPIDRLLSHAAYIAAQCYEDYRLCPVRLQQWRMESLPDVRVTYAARLDGGVVVTFSDDRCALYSASLLNHIFAQAQDLGEHLNDDWQEATTDEP